MAGLTLAALLLVLELLLKAFPAIGVLAQREFERGLAGIKPGLRQGLFQVALVALHQVERFGTLDGHARLGISVAIDLQAHVDTPQLGRVEANLEAVVALMDLADNDLLDLLLQRREPAGEQDTEEAREVLGMLRQSGGTPTALQA